MYDAGSRASNGTADRRLVEGGCYTRSSSAPPVRTSRTLQGQVAQLVEHMTENHGVGGSIPSLATMQKESRSDGGPPRVGCDQSRDTEPECRSYKLAAGVWVIAETKDLPTKLVRIGVPNRSQGL